MPRRWPRLKLPPGRQTRTQNQQPCSEYAYNKIGPNPSSAVSGLDYGVHKRIGHLPQSVADLLKIRARIGLETQIRPAVLRCGVHHPFTIVQTCGRSDLRRHRSRWARSRQGGPDHSQVPSQDRAEDVIDLRYCAGSPPHTGRSQWEA